jgi:hypothetical protein
MLKTFEYMFKISFVYNALICYFSLLMDTPHKYEILIKTIPYNRVQKVKHEKSKFFVHTFRLKDKCAT